MSPSHAEVPVLPSVVLLAAVGFAVLVWRLHRRAALTPPRVAVSGTAAVYAAGVVGNTLLPIQLGGGGSGVPWWELPNLTPLAGTEPADVLMNVVLFAPLGVLLPLVVRFRSVWWVLLTGFLLSLAMELLQWVNAVAAHGGHVPDVNDLLANTVGAPLGYGAFQLALLVPVLARWAAAATWPGRATAEPAVRPAPAVR